MPWQQSAVIIEGQLENTERAVNSIEPAKNKYLKVLSDKIELQSKIESRQAALAEAVEALHCSLEYKNVASGGQMHPEFRKLGSRFFYIERNVRRDWFGAAQKCREMGGQLALPQDEAEFSLIHQQLGSNGHWLDISDLAEKNKEVDSRCTGDRVTGEPSEETSEVLNLRLEAALLPPPIMR
ncbi:accessory gland protein Acp29AB-like [Drosophila ficusphila]|uniref:accessory gland protein Acp29AB-like n=1 Tax=Drosophila ficusphila TaxID=30025 RepID=UPI0007E6C74B|nr:accessory gland protein Acp29AB-like [Drosophila ficusphila]